MAEPIGKFEIIIKNESGSGGSGNRAKRAGAKKLEEGGEVSSSGTIGKIFDAFSPNLKNLTLSGGAMIVKHVVDEVVMYNNSLIEIRTGSREAQQRATYTYNTASSYVGSALSNATKGALFGPVGMAVGATYGVVKTGIQRAVTYAKNSYRLSEEKRLEDISRNMAAQRETISGSRYMNAGQM